MTYAKITKTLLKKYKEQANYYNKSLDTLRVQLLEEKQK